MNLGVILPALNAARHLPAVVADLRAAQPGIRVLVVDDGSSDGTAAAARQAGAEVITHPRNLGKGAALMTGYHWAVQTGLEWVFTMDADGQHLPQDMKGFLDAVAGGSLDVVVGSRMDRTADMPWVRKMTNLFTSWVVSRLAGCRIPDSQNGFRLYRVACLEDVRIKATRYDAESEILVRLARRGYRIGSAPVTTVYGDEKSSINPLVDTGRFFRLVARLIFTRD
ncbi:MAG: glycosyltransferase family 2 protein [bacterium]